MPAAGLRWGSIARAVAACAVLALVAELSHAHVQLDEECARCIIVEQGDTAEPSATSGRASFADSQKTGAGAGRASASSPTLHQPRAPPFLA